MSEKLGFVFALLIFSLFIIPVGANLWLLNFQADYFMKTASEVQKLTAENGGVTEEVLNATSALSENGYEIRFYDENGEEVVGQCDPGAQITIEYEYTYENFSGGEGTMKTQNIVIVEKRNIGIDE